MAAKMRKSTGEKVFDAFNYTFIVLFCLTVLYPFMREVTLSISTPVEAERISLHAFPKWGQITLSSYSRIFKTGSLGSAYFWTVLRTAVGTSLTLLVASMMAYPLAKKYLPLRGTFTGIVVFTMFFSGGLIPTYLLVRSLHLVNTVWALILPVLIDPFTLIIMRNYMMSLPEELEESARMDGASDLFIFMRIVVPLSMPILATVALWTMVLHWNSWFDAMIYITKPRIKVLQLLLRRVLLESQFSYAGVGTDVLAGMKQERLLHQYTPDTIKAAILMASTLPILAAYPFLQKYFVKGIMIGSLKG